jgi:hypothetical protein
VDSLATKQADVNKELARFVAETAVFIQRRGWSEAALALLEAGAPLAFLGGQLVWLAQPLLSVTFPAAKIQQVAYLLEDPAALEVLRSLLYQENDKVKG